MREFDIVIIGGGMVGLAMAAALADTPLRIAVVEKNDFETLLQGEFLSKKMPGNDGFETRVSAISPGNQAFLSALDCWQRLPACRVADYERMRVWDGEGSGSITFDAAEISQPKLGSIVENQALRAALYDRLGHLQRVEFISGVELNSLQQTKNTRRVALSSGEELDAKLVIGADGALSAVRRQLSIACHENQYRQMAFVANVETEKPHQNTAWQRFTRYGPVAFLPLTPPNLCSVVWTLDDEKAQAVKALSSADFERQLGRAFEFRLGNLSLQSDVRGFPLVKRHAQRYLVSNCALIGDAAHTIHPLAGLGVNLGFQDAASLSKVIKQQLGSNRDFSLMANLRRFERERKAENVLVQQSMSGFKHLFGQRDLLPTLMRNWGLSAMDRLQPLKQTIARRTLGL